ncbi:MAG: TonB-dependent receptor [Pseudoxanthomonas sp.]|nr:TonB-dependent receptor [Pseudoxanthomonas sp.]
MLVVAFAAASSPWEAPAAPARDDDDEPPAKTTELDRITVTARRREERLMQVPQAITAITGEELDSRGATNIAALDMVTPNLTLYPARAFNGSLTAYIRGIGQFDPIWGVEPGVGIYLDDVHLARPQGALLDVVDVERVEVLRGPQGTLYGRNTLGGAIKVVTRAPEPEFGGKVGLTVGDYGRRDGRLVLNVPLAEDFRTRLALASYDRDGYGRNLFTGGEVSARDAAVARFSALWTPTPDLDVGLAYDRYRDRSGAPGARRLAVPPLALDPAQTPLDPGRHDVRSEAPERLDLDNEGASVTVDWAFRPQWRLRSISAWRQGESHTVLDMDSLSQPIWVLGRDFSERQRSQEFQLHRDGEGAHLVTGLYLFDGIESGDGRSSAKHFMPTNFFRAAGSIRTRSVAAFADWVRDLGTAWQLELGLRYSTERKSVDAFNASYADASFTTPVVTTADFSDSARYSEPTPRAALSWRASEATMLYVQVSRGYKGGSYNVRANVLTFPLSAHPLDAETVLAWEAGAKGDWLDGRLGWSAAVFHNDYHDIQLSVLTNDGEPTSGFPDFRNAGDGTTQGAELEWQARLGPLLQWTSHLGYLEARYDQYIDDGMDVASSRYFPNAPRWTAGTSLVADFPLARAGWLLARIDSRYQAMTRPTTDLNPLLLQPGYSIWNASLAWTSPERRWELTARVENLGDTSYRTTGFAYPVGIVTGYYGPPRNCSLTLAYSF